MVTLATLEGPMKYKTYNCRSKLAFEPVTVLNTKVENTTQLFFI